MRAVVVEKRGGVEALQCVELLKPEPGSDQLLIRTEFAGLNYADVMQREGRYPAVLPLPYVPGNEVAGVVEAVGGDVSEYAVGDRVAAVMLQGGYAEHVVASSAQVFALPDGVGAAAATALLVQGFTAHLLVNELVRAGDRVLVTAAAGGVGSLVLQLARIRGAVDVVGAVGSAQKCELVATLGARAVRYDRPGWEEEARSLAGGDGFRVVIDAVGGAIRDACYRVLAPFGRMGIYGNSGRGEEHWNAERWHSLLMANQSVFGFAVTHWMAAHPGFPREAFSHLADAVARGDLVLPLHPVYPLDEVQQAHLDLAARRTSGKVVLAL